MRFPFLQDEKFYHAAAVLVGTMIGAGIYGIPFAFAKAGFWVGTLWLVLLMGIVAFFDILFAELILSTPGVHQVSGYVNVWLGPRARWLSTVAYLISMYGALLAYIIVAGEFLHNTLSHFLTIDPQLYSVCFALIGALFWFLRVKTIAKIEVILITLYTIAVLSIVVLGASSVRFENFVGSTPEYWYLPYGVLLFAFAGLSALPLQRQLLSGRERLMRPAIIGAILFTALLYMLFAFVVVGVSGDATSPSALAGLYSFLGTPMIVLGSILGILTITTSYIILGTALFETLHVDYRQRPSIAWFFVVTPPLLFFIAGLRNFIDIIGLVGAVALGVQCVLLLIAYVRARRHRTREPEVSTPVSTLFVIALALFFTCGVVAELLLR